MKKVGFSLVEILVVMAIIAVIAGIVFAATINAVASGKSAVCVSNLKQIGLALTMYSEDNNDSWPVYEFDHDYSHKEQIETDFKNDLAIYKLSEPQWWCPLDPHKGGAYDGAVVTASNFINSSYIALLDLAPFGTKFGLPKKGESDTFKYIIHPSRCPTFASTICFADGVWSTIDSLDPQYMVTAHGHRTNVLYLDNHVQNEGIHDSPTK